MPFIVFVGINIKVKVTLQAYAVLIIWRNGPVGIISCKGR